jgi:peptide/nickel transport system ATP-binding protein
MYLGRIVEQGRAEEVLRAPRHPYTQALLSAVPVPSLEAKTAVIKLPGETPSPANPPSGCHFHPRCPQASAICRERYPQNSPVSVTHSVNCHLFS